MRALLMATALTPLMASLQVLPSAAANITLGAGGGNDVFSGAIGGPDSLEKVGAGTTTLTGANTFTGGTTITAGTLALGAGGSLSPSGALTLTGPGATFDISGSGGAQAIGALSGINGSTVALGGNTLTFGDATNQAFAGNISGTGGLVKQGSGIETLSGANTFSGGTALNAGGLVLGNAGSLGTGTITVGGASTLDVSASMTLSNTVVLNAGLTLLGSNDLRLDGVISSTGTLTKTGATALTLNGANTFSGGTVLTGGRLVLGNNGALGSGALTVGGASLLDVSGAVTLSNTVVLNAGLTLPGTNDLTLDGVISGTGTLTKNGMATLTLNGANTFSGGVILNDGALTLGNGAALGSGTLTVGGAVSLDTSASVTLSNDIVLFNPLSLTGSNALTLSGTLSGVGSLTKNGAALLSLSGANTFSGGVTLNSGSLVLGNAAALGTGTLTVGGAASLDASTALSMGNNIVLNAGLTLSGSNALTVSGAISGTGSLTKDGTATVTLTGANTVTGGTYISTGTLALGAGGSLSSGGLVNVSSGGTFDISASGAGQMIGSLSGTGGSAVVLGARTLTLHNAGNYVFSGAISGTGGLIMDGPDTMTLTGSNSFTGGSTINTGTLALGPGGSLAATGAVDLQNNAVFDISTAGANQTIGELRSSSNTAIVELGANDLAFGGTGIVTLDASIHGTGGIIKQGSGTLILAGANTYSGGTTLNAGALEISSTTANLGALAFGGGTLKTTDDIVLTQAVQLNAGGGGFDVAPTKTLTIDGIITGAGQLTKSGTGTMVLTAANTYAGGTLVLGGELVVDADSLPGNAQVGSGAFITFEQNADGTYTGGISGAGSVIARGNGTLTLTALQSYTGQTTIDAEALQATTAILDKDISVSAGKALIFNQSTTGSYMHVLSGAGGLVKTGTGTVYLSGNNTYTGQTIVNAGALRINGEVVGTVTVASGATLGGTGTIRDSVAINSGGIHAPGNSIGTQTILGNYVNNGVLQVEVDPAHADKLVVGGTVDITGASLDILLSSNNAALWASNASPYTIIDNGSGTSVTGRFGPLANLVFLTADLNYAGGDGNDIDLTLTRNAVSFPSVAQTANQQAIAASVEALGSGAVYDAIVGGSDSDLVRKSFDALSGEVHASLKGVLLDQSDIVNKAMADRVRSAFDGVATSTAPVLSYGPGGPEFTAADTGDMVVWGQGVGVLGKMDGNDNAAGIDTSMAGLLAGADALVGDWRLGLLAGYSQSAFEIDDRSSSSDSDNYLLGLYGGTQLGGLGVRTGLAYGWHDLSTSRTVALLNQTLTADYGADTIQAFGELGYGFDLGNAVRFEPYANLAYVRLDTDGFSETGGSAALSNLGSTADAAFTTLGLRASTQMAWGETLATLRGGVGWRHAFADDPSILNALAGGPDFSIVGTPLTEDSAVIEAGLDLNLSAKANLGVTYNGQFAASAQNHALSAKLAVGF